MPSLSARTSDPTPRRYCSAACRKRKRQPVDLELEACILGMLESRARDASLCPSEAARKVSAENDDWRTLMEPARRAARRLVASGAVEITQKNRVVDPSTAKGPIRVRRAHLFPR